jgi:hypothetical protein
MIEEKTFEAITTQEEFDERIKARLARERERWEKQSGTDDLKAQLEAKDQEISSIKREHYLEAARRAVVSEISRRGVDDEGRIQRIMRLIDLEAIEAGEDGKPDRGHVLSQLDSVASDVPELVRPRGAGSGGSRQPVLTPEKPLSRDEVEAMSEEEVNSNWDRVKAFLAGERS